MRILRLDSDTKQNLLEDLLKRSPNQYGQYEEGVARILAGREGERRRGPFLLH